MISEVFNTNCLDYMKSVPDKYFSLAIADPPYGLNAAKMGMGGTADNRRAARKLYKEHTERVKGRLNSGGGKLKGRLLNQSSIGWDSKTPSQEFFDELFRISENQIIWGGNYFDLPPTRCVVCWDKVQPWENFSQVEIAWTSFDYPAKLFRFDNRTGDKIHPVQKPVELYAFLLRNFAKQGDKIFDPMTGSGSSRIAAYKLGFDFYGCEINSDYFNSAQSRFNRECLHEVTTKDGKTIKELSLFGM